MPSFNFRKSKQSSNTKFYKQFYKFCNIFQIPVYQSDFLINWKKKKRDTERQHKCDYLTGSLFSAVLGMSFLWNASDSYS